MFWKRFIRIKHLLFDFDTKITLKFSFTLKFDALSERAEFPS